MSHRCYASAAAASVAVAAIAVSAVAVGTVAAAYGSDSFDWNDCKIAYVALDIQGMRSPRLGMK